MLCADDNIQVVNCTTPANFFHVLRRQMVRDFRKPLVVFTPKSLLRHPRCVSPLRDLSNGRFLEVMDDPHTDARKVRRVLLFSGKVYYDLLEKKEKLDAEEIALIRLEQLDPLPREQIAALQTKYGEAEWVWVQEEPENMGAWSHLLRKLPQVKLSLIARPASGASATGSGQRHRTEQKQLIERAFGKPNAIA